MGDSIAAAVRATRDAPGWLVLPGDLPLVRAGTLLRVADALAGGAEVVVPVHDGRRGHPVAFSAACGDELATLEGPQGAASVVKAHAVTELQVDDVGTVVDIDTVEALEEADRMLEGR
jgi:molybdenum cofactor cytidylyltransferase